MKYTPGPWTAILNSSWGEKHKEQFGDRSGFVICHKERGELTCLASIIGMPFRTQDEINANAILIEAAPDMIDVIEKVDKYFIDLQNRCALTPSEEKLWSKITAVKYKALWYEPTKKR